MTTETEAPAQHPLFLEHDVSAIARRMGYNEFYLLRLKFGAAKLTPTFRRKAERAFADHRCAWCRKHSPRELFNEGGV